MNYQELIETICKAALANQIFLQDYYQKNTKADKTNCIKDFQDYICNYLNCKMNSNCNIINSNLSYNWEEEVQPSGRVEKDSIDIMGTPLFASNTNDLTCIIEIDACRSDQVAEKFLSRLALWGKKDPIIYVALLYYYPDTSKNMVKKYIRFATEIMREINSKSIVVGLYIDVYNSNPTPPPKVEVWDYNKKGHYFKTTFEITDKKGTSISCNTMNDCASKAIKLYIQNNSKKTYDDIKKVFKNFVGDAKSRSLNKQTTKKVCDKHGKLKPIFSYTQFRHYGNQANWTDFVRICKKKGIKIEEIVPTVS